jgi:hypothetical protein
MRWLQASILSSIIVALMASHVHAQDREALLSGAWDSFNRQDYASAIRLASPCVDQFVRQAQREQARIETGEAPKPLPAGPVPDRNSQDAKRTFANGVLNDAAACLFIVGASQERTSLCADARKTYQVLVKLTYARVWDPKGWFWAPAEAADDGLDRLKGHC